MEYIGEINKYVATHEKISIFVSIVTVIIVGVIIEHYVKKDDNGRKYVNILEWFNIIVTPILVTLIITINKMKTPGILISFTVGLLLFYYIVNIHLIYKIDRTGETFGKSNLMSGVSSKLSSVFSKVIPETDVTSDISSNITNTASGIKDEASKQAKKIASEMGFSGLPTKTLLYILSIWVIYRLTFWLQSLTILQGTTNEEKDKVNNYLFGFLKTLGYDNSKYGIKGTVKSIYDNIPDDNKNISIARCVTPYIENELCGLSYERFKLMLVAPFLMIASPIRFLWDYTMSIIYGNTFDSNKVIRPFSLNVGGCLHVLTYYIFSYVLYLFTFRYAYNVLWFTGFNKSNGLTGLVIGLILILFYFFSGILNEFFSKLMSQFEESSQDITKLPVAKAVQVPDNIKPTVPVIPI
jgi:hypothetical protein